MRTIIHEKFVRLTAPWLSKGALAAGGFLLMLPAAHAQFTWPVYEPFGEYTNGTPLGVTNATTGSAAAPWWGSIGNGVSSSNPHVQDYAALSYPALLGDPNATPKGLTSSTVTGSHDAAAPFTSHSGTIYASFLINNINNQGTTIDRMFFSLNTGTSASGGFGMSVYLTSDYRLKIRKNPSGNPSGAFTGPTLPLTTNGTHLVVIRYLATGGNDEVDLWLDPPPFGDNASIPTPTLSTTNGANVSSFKLLVVPSRGTGLYTYYMDEIRLGDTWASVTPLATSVPGPLFGATGGGIGCQGDTFSVDLSGSVTTNDYLLYTNGVYAGNTITGTGSSISFGQQSTIGYYSVLASNNVSGNLGWMSNSVSINVRASVNIVTQPVPVTCATNNRAQFTVISTGDLLVYRWYKDGTSLADDAHITGSGTSNLVIWPAANADIGNYYCVVTNVCSLSPTYSTTNSLSLTAPSNLVWAGDAFNVCVWDVFTATAEWNNGPTFFHPGDNVTFDDTYIYPNNVTLNGILTPTSIQVNATRDYAWVGNGSIAGSNSLVKSGSGALILNNNSANLYTNSYAGGTVINSGTINITNGWLNLGSGSLTLAGGTLESWNKGTGVGDPTVGGLPNNILVTASSTWLLDRTGDQCAGLLGTLNGTAGLTFSLTNSATLTNSVNRIRFGGLFTNGLDFALSVNSLATNSAQEIATWHSTGVQVYNGAISGQNGGFFVAGTGAVYLNGANTYARDTFVNAGFLAGSGSISGRLLVTNGATLGAGSQTAIGTFTVNSNALLFGNILIRVDKSLVQSNDMISATGIITNGGTGTLTITNIGGTPIGAGDTFKIFSGAVINGSTISVTDGILAWTNKLAFDGSVQALSVIPSYPTNITFSVSGSTLTIAWPATHLGWILQSQTNSLSVGIRTNNWFDVAGSSGVASVPFTIIPTNPTVFYRLRHP